MHPQHTDLESPASCKEEYFDATYLISCDPTNELCRRSLQQGTGKTWIPAIEQNSDLVHGAEDNVLQTSRCRVCRKR